MAPPYADVLHSERVQNSTCKSPVLTIPEIIVLFDSVCQFRKEQFRTLSEFVSVPNWMTDPSLMLVKFSPSKVHEVISHCASPES